MTKPTITVTSWMDGLPGFMVKNFTIRLQKDMNTAATTTTKREGGKSNVKN